MEPKYILLDTTVVSQLGQVVKKVVEVDGTASALLMPSEHI